MNMETIEIITKLQEVMAPVAQKIGEGAQYGWEVVVRQQYVEAVLGLVWFICSLIALKTLLYPWFKKLTAKNYDERWDEAGWFPFGIVSILVLIAGGFGLEVFITHIINPEYYAIEFFINLVQ